MRWELGSDTISCLCVPSGCVNLVFHVHPVPENLLRSKIVGVRTATFAVDMCGSGASFGLRFTPAGFHAFSKKDGSYFTDKVFPLDEVFGPQSKGIEEVVLSDDSVSGKARRLEQILSRFVQKEMDPGILDAHRIMEVISEDSSIKNTVTLAKRLCTTERTLQRVFAKYVGISPTMWIRTKRFQQAAKEVISGTPQDWSNLALELGYYDQSHFINDFKDLTGRRPSELVAGCQTFCRPFPIRNDKPPVDSESIEGRGLDHA